MSNSSSDDFWSFSATLAPSGFFLDFRLRFKAALTCSRAMVLVFWRKAASLSGVKFQSRYCVDARYISSSVIIVLEIKF